MTFVITFFFFLFILPLFKLLLNITKLISYLISSRLFKTIITTIVIILCTYTY